MNQLRMEEANVRSSVRSWGTGSFPKGCAKEYPALYFVQDEVISRHELDIAQGLGLRYLDCLFSSSNRLTGSGSSFHPLILCMLIEA